jgi:4-phosphopantoate--beta-alanine ligase
MTNHEIPKDHPRYESLLTREKIIQGLHQNIVAEAGLIAHGRGEAFDYILGERSPEFALHQERLAVLTMLLADYPVISVNGNVASLCASEIVELGVILEAPLEINLFYRTKEREEAINEVLIKAGGENIFGMEPGYQSAIPEITHQRRIIDSRGIGRSDCVFVPLEDGDRTMALKKLGKDVVTVDLNPLSRTSLSASVSITNNIIRAIPEMINIAEELNHKTSLELKNEKKNLKNESLLQQALKFLSSRLSELGNTNKLFEI